MTRPPTLRSDRPSLAPFNESKNLQLHVRTRDPEEAVLATSLRGGGMQPGKATHRGENLGRKGGPDPKTGRWQQRPAKSTTHEPGLSLADGEAPMGSPTTTTTSSGRSSARDPPAPAQDNSPALPNDPHCTDSRLVASLLSPPSLLAEATTRSPPTPRSRADTQTMPRRRRKALRQAPPVHANPPWLTRQQAHKMALLPSWHAKSFSRTTGHRQASPSAKPFGPTS